MTAGELSPFTLFAGASGVVQSVFVVLAFASLAAWSLIVEKLLVLHRLADENRRFGADARPADGLAGRLCAAADDAAARRLPGESAAERRERIAATQRETLAEALLAAESRLGHLATIASAAPFVGLFGTVWGVMHAFAGLAGAAEHSLAAVAPGIAEALAATAVGLLTALPAAVGYNKLAGDFNLLSRRLQLAVAAHARRLAEAAEAA